MIEFRSVTKQFPAGKLAVEDFSLILPSRKTTARVGSSGAGRPTTARATAVQGAAPSARRRRGARMRVRRVREVDVRFDEAIAHQDRIEQILRDLHQEEAKRNAPTDDEHSADKNGGD